ncbi:MAG TPA: glucokinase, partial [Longimicrobium sp.]|nr:glucokinase [Longimicrobium sp.]
MTSPGPRRLSTPGTGGSARFRRPSNEGEGLLLAGDIGGTKTVLALVSESGGSARIVAEAVFPSREYASLEAVVAAFRATHPGGVGRAAFSVAGPVIGGVAHITNLPWCLDEPRLAEALGVDEVLLVNDLQATAYALPHLRADQV